ncbi:unnamed protein product [Cylicostephanus goldi]|uniref:Adenosine 3'-phospho 5'-phosphosulfate transporter 2 n=1 Tax=Cylicostephanus goldi TaxID=71465 RepID=A0A3P7PYH0_CYLGO|nr:unnamed protein product [Cylicostephanus goldi]
MLPTHAREKPPSEQLHLVGFNITFWPLWLQFTSLSLAIFVFYVGYGYMQELIFKLPGMKPFGVYLTLIQFIIYSVCGWAEGTMYHERSRKIPLRVYFLLAFFTVLTMGLSNASVGYLNYPTQSFFSYMLPTHAREKPPSEQLHLVGFNITFWPLWLQFTSLSLAIFVFYVGYGYMQELIFKLPGMKPFGVYLTLIQFIIYSVCGWAEGTMYHERSRKIPLRVYFLLAFFTVLTMGLSNASVGYLNYPTQVIFKCCKLIPVLIGGIIIQGKRYGWLDASAAALMSIGLIMFVLADSHVSPNFDPRGYIMISGALVADAIIGNLQEKVMKKYGGSSNEMVFYSYSIGSVYILGITILTGEFFEAFEFFLNVSLLFSFHGMVQ